MRYEVWPPNRKYNHWYVWDTETAEAVLTASPWFPDAEALIRSQAAFLNESPAMKEAA